MELQKDSIGWHRNERAIALCDEAMEILFQINREFDSIERRYNRLIDQKRTFAKRAAARIRYILVEGNIEEDRTKALVRLLNNSSRKEEIMNDLGQRFGMTERFQVIKEKSFLRPRNGEKAEFTPQMIESAEEKGQNLEEFVVKPLYTEAELRAFREQNEVDGAFQVTEQTVQGVEDLEKLLFVWQEATEVAANALDIEIGEEFKTEDGMQYSGFSIRRK